MIWFTCQSCGKKHGRAESSSGSLVFCECGQGNTVPWESSAEPEITVQADLLPPAPELAPVKFTMEPSPTRPSPPARPAALDDDRPRRLPPPRTRPRQRDPRFCLHHPGVASQRSVRDCKNGFCQDCLVQIEGEPLCGPCKNQRASVLHRPSPTSQLAMGSLLLALFTSPLAFCYDARPAALPVKT